MKQYGDLIHGASGHKYATRDVWVWRAVVGYVVEQAEQPENFSKLSHPEKATLATVKDHIHNDTPKSLAAMVHHALLSKENQYSNNRRLELDVDSSLNHVVTMLTTFVVSTGGRAHTARPPEEIWRKRSHLCLTSWEAKEQAKARAKERKESQTEAMRAMSPWRE